MGLYLTTQYYAIQKQKEAEEYISHSILGMRLREISKILLELDFSDTKYVLGVPDDIKLKFFKTLFYLVSQEELFLCVLEKFFVENWTKKQLKSKKNRVLFSCFF